MESLVEGQRSNRKSWKVEFGIEIGSRATGGAGFCPMDLEGGIGDGGDCPVVEFG